MGLSVGSPLWYVLLLVAGLLTGALVAWLRTRNER